MCKKDQAISDSTFGFANWFLILWDRNPIDLGVSRWQGDDQDRFSGSMQHRIGNTSKKGLCQHSLPMASKDYYVASLFVRYFQDLFRGMTQPNRDIVN